MYRTDRVSREGKSICDVHLSVRLAVRFFPLYIMNSLIHELAFLCVFVGHIARLGLKVSVIGRCQRSTCSAYRRSNAVTQSV